MTSEVDTPDPRKHVSVRRVALVVIPIAMILLAGVWLERWQSEERARASDESTRERVFGIRTPTKNRLAAEYDDRDGDLVADPPALDAQLISPETLVFSYVAGAESERQKEVWQPLIDAISEATGRPVEYLVLNDPEDQLMALKEGSLHISGLNTGLVPKAVNACGFVPVSTLARADGTYGYTMQIIVKADCPIKEVEDLRPQGERKERITFTRPGSNSGFKAPVVLLMNDYDLHLMQDYEYRFSTSHSESIREITSGDSQVATVASDLLERAIELDGVDPMTFRSIYTSARFPPAALGHVYNLDPQLAEKIREVLVRFQFAGTTLEEEFAPSQVTQLVAANYKDDWDTIRMIDDALGYVHELETVVTAAAASPAAQ